jgi:hypothetical protein
VERGFVSFSCSFVEESEVVVDRAEEDKGVVVDEEQVGVRSQDRGEGSGALCVCGEGAGDAVRPSERDPEFVDGKCIDRALVECRCARFRFR